jgi:Icc-related predicted phosphoesterase
MKIVALSDTHLKTDSLSVPDGDVLIHAGDALNSGSQEEFLRFFNWFSSLPHKRKIYVPGNHDWFTFDHYGLALAMLRERDINILVDQELVIENVRFYGTPWVPEYCGWAWMLDELELAGPYGEIPEKTDVLISHGPPRGFLDKTFRGESVGSFVLLEAIKRTKPTLIICGHVHEGAIQGDGEGHDYIYHDDGSVTHIANVSIVNKYYDPVYEPKVFQLK